MNSSTNNSLIRISTCGSVDDGKSTLIGRLLIGTKSVPLDQFIALDQIRKNQGKEELNLAFITDGLKEERAQGITIDVAYRYFSTPRRKYVIADSPGHREFTRNMVTGAADSDVAVLLIDAVNGVTNQSKLHAVLNHLLGVPRLIVCINKMDLIQFDEKKYLTIVNELSEFIGKLHFKTVDFIPVSALKGENITEASKNMKWFKDNPLLNHLEEINVYEESHNLAFRMTLQIDSVGKNSLAYGRVNNGTAKVGDILLLNNEMKVEINTIYKGLEERVAVTMGDSVVFSLQEDIKLTRGDMLCDIKSPCNKTNRIDADICWFDATRDMNFDIVYLLRHTTKIVEARIEKCHYRLNTINLSREEGKIISANEIGHVTILMNDFIYTDPYIENRNTGSFIIIDPLTNNTVAVGMIR